MEITIEIQGQDAISAVEELLKIEGVQGSYETIDEIEKDSKGTITTIASIVGIIAGTMTIGEKLYQWCQKYQQPETSNTQPIEKVIIIMGNDNRLLLNDKTPQQIDEFLEKK